MTTRNELDWEYVMRLLWQPTEWGTVIGLIEPEELEDPAARDVFRAIRHLRERGAVPDAISVWEVLRGWGVKAGPRDLARGQAYGPAKTIGLLIAERSIRKATIKAAGAAVKSLEGGEDPLEVVARLSTELLGTMNRGIAGSLERVAEGLEAIIDEMTSGTHVTGLLTGIHRLDELLGGFRPGDMVVIAGRPSIGKTAWMCNLLAAIDDQGEAAAGINLEMSREQLKKRMMAQYGGVAVKKTRQTSLLDEYEKRALREGATRLAGARLWLTDQAAMPIEDIIAKVATLHAKERLAAVVVDYLQLVTMRERITAREERVGKISALTKAAAKDLGLVWFNLAQLNRKVEERGTKRPQLSDLRESGAIEQDADTVLMLHRPERYGIEIEGGQETRNRIWTLVEKARHGETGEAIAAFEGGRVERLNPVDGALMAKHLRPALPDSRVPF